MTRTEAVAAVADSLDRAFAEHRERIRLQRERCIHAGTCGDPFCQVDGSDER